MENVFDNSNDDLLQSNAENVNYDLMVKNLSEVIWFIDLTVEPYKIQYLNNPKVIRV